MDNMYNPNTVLADDLPFFDDEEQPSGEELFISNSIKRVGSIITMRNGIGPCAGKIVMADFLHARLRGEQVRAVIHEEAAENRIKIEKIVPLKTVTRPVPRRRLQEHHP